MHKLKRYTVFSAKTGELLVSGIAKECAASLGMSESGFRNAVARFERFGHPKYEIFEETGGEDEKALHHELLNAAKAWDAFMEPIRKAYGIPVYRHQKEG